MKTATVIGGLLMFCCMGMTQAQDQKSTLEGRAIIASATDMQDPKFQWDCFVYPVPAVDEINVKVTKGKVEIREVRITNDSGDDVLTSDVVDGDKIKVDISTLSNGKYYLVIFPKEDFPVVMKRFYISK